MKLEKMNNSVIANTKKSRTIIVFFLILICLDFQNTSKNNISKLYFLPSINLQKSRLLIPELAQITKAIKKAKNWQNLSYLLLKWTSWEKGFPALLHSVRLKI